MRGQDDRGPVGRIAELGHEDRTLGFQVGHDVGVVDDLAAHVDRRAEALERALDDFDGPLDPGAERAGAGQEDVVGSGGPGPALERRADAEQRPEPSERDVRGAVGSRPPGLHDRPHDGDGMVRQLAGQPGRLHVPGDGARPRPGPPPLRPRAATRRRPVVRSGRGGPGARRSPATRSAPGSGRGGVPSVVRSSVATTSAPGARSGAKRRAMPERATGVPAANDSLMRVPVAHACSMPTPVSMTPPPIASASVRVGRQHGEVSHDPTPARSDRAPSPGRPGGRGGS